MNNTRVRASMDPARIQLLPSGTSSNEALHSELSVCFRQTQALHQATLQLKLGCFTLAEQLSHENAMYHPTVRQVRIPLRHWMRCPLSYFLFEAGLPAAALLMGSLGDSW